MSVRVHISDQEAVKVSTHQLSFGFLDLVA